MNTKKVAIVTGSNKGIGFGIVKGLCQRWQGDVYLTSRDVTRGQNAIAELNKLGLYPKFHQLDITSEESIEKLRDHIRETYGGIDILVNNAAIAFKKNATEPFGLQAEETIRVNYFSVLSTCKILFPILNHKAKVVNVSSIAGQLFRIPSEDLRKKFADDNLTEPVLSDLIMQFVQSAINGTNVADGWGASAYIVSKVALNALTFMQNREYGAKGFYINCVHPGLVKTDMSSNKNPMSIEEGAEGPLCLALQSEEKNYKGVFMWYDCSIVDWKSENSTRP